MTIILVTSYCSHTLADYPKYCEATASAYVAGLFFPFFPTARRPNTALSLLIGRSVVFAMPTFNMCVHYNRQSAGHSARVT